MKAKEMFEKLGYEYKETKTIIFKDIQYKVNGGDEEDVK